MYSEAYDFRLVGGQSRMFAVLITHFIASCIQLYLCPDPSTANIINIARADIVSAIFCAHTTIQFDLLFSMIRLHMSYTYQN